MKKRMLRVWLLALVMCLAVMTGCVKEATTVEDEPTEAPTPSPTPTIFVPTPLPTITPRPVSGEVQTPEAGATALVIAPMDKPTREPLVFNYTEYVSQELGISFNIPSDWIPSTVEGSSNAIVFTEPAVSAQQGFQSTVTITVSTFSSAQTLADAETELDNIINLLREQFASMEVSSKADNSMMGEKGRYVTYRIYMDTGEEEPLTTRGRILVIPKDKKLYQVRYLCPADFNSDYEKIYKEIRSSIAEL